MTQEAKTSVRTNTRIAAVKALYSNEINENFANDKNASELSEAIQQYYSYENKEQKLRLDKEFLLNLIEGTITNQDKIDEIACTYLIQGWSLDRLGPVLRNILRAAIFELMNYETTPLKIIINEYVNITRLFFDEKEVGFANGILDKIAHSIRSD